MTAGVPGQGVEFLRTLPGVPAPRGPYSQAVAVGAKRLLFVSGQVPEDANGELVGRGSLEAQARQVFVNLQRTVEGAGGRLSDVVKTGILLVDVTPAGLEVLGRVRREFFGERLPASTLAGVTGLASPEWLIEVEAWAALD